MIFTKSLLYAARTYPEKLAIIDGKHKFSYRELINRTAKLKQSLQGKGIKKGDRVGMLMLNDFRYIELMYGVTALGAIVVPLNIRSNPEELAFILNNAGVTILYIHKEFLPVVPYLKGNVSGVRHFILAEDAKLMESIESDDIESYEKLIDAQPDGKLAYEGVDDEDIVGIFYTGGTTGRPKGVMLTHKNLTVNSYHMLANIKCAEDDVYLHAAPMFHLADQASTNLFTMLGATHAIIRMFTPQGVLQAIQDAKVTVCTLVPTMLNFLFHDPEFQNYNLSSLRRLTYGASPMSIALLKKSQTMMPHVKFNQAFGMTETAPVLTILKEKDHIIGGTEKEEKRLTSCGQAVQGVEIKVVNPEGNEVPNHQVGELIARGANIMKGYWDLPEETAHAIRAGWYYTGDLGYKDEDEYYYIVDRAKDMIITGGENVYSIEVEEVLSSHPAILECAVFGIPDERWGETVKACVVLKTPDLVTEEDIISFAKQHLATYKVPKTVVLLDELPKSGAGKILKRTLRDQFWKGSRKLVN
ncbi:fatty-acid--CoA ligase [Sporosarcina sp. P2]|uniref:long-chain-fatty-acid--CoA ligase n=1 Tax=Sporosarcina sp. P2 TaxID=2048251 RepID=UPI000C16C1A7|nr:long-chain-fatty-acid--CoA ligase [Sporosarcina sp. P2]PID04057.1 fatty-acid--CoA ligase [Sporosarcina sp. P2]